MREEISSRAFLMLLICAALLSAEPVTVRHTEGLIHGFLALSAMDGTLLAHGDAIQTSANNRVTNRLVFRFKDGSVRDEIAVYSQRGNFRLLTYHLTQKGAAFDHPIDMSFNSSSGEVTVRYTEDDGKEKSVTERLKLPPDLANGMTFTVLKNIRRDGPTTVSLVTATKKPRIAKLVITPQGEEPFSAGGSERKAMHYVLKAELGGLAGVIAPLVGKQAPDVHVWVLGGEAPAFVKMEGPLYFGGPIWRIELASPVWASR